MANFEEYDFVIPTWAICYLEYGDGSGLEDEDIKKVDEFLDQLNQIGIDNDYQGYHFAWPETDEDSYFAARNDINGYLGATVVDAKVMFLKKS